MYHVSAQGVDERMINVHYYYIIITTRHKSNVGVKLKIRLMRMRSKMVT